MTTGGSELVFKYWAFISYSHRDKAWGEWLHKALETYRVPPRFVGKDSGGGPIPKRLTPIFRDKDELSSSADLGRIINEALEQSRSLIVICSPAAAQSRWVNEEVLAFKRLGRADQIFAFIVAGEPNVLDLGRARPPGAPQSGGSGSPALPQTQFPEECFPQGLKFHLNPDGTLSDRPAEPIAADARKGQDTKADAKLRLLAGLMGVSYDELKQRERQRQRKRLLVGLAALLLACVTAGALVHQAWKARHELKSSAPAYYAQAEALLGKGNRAEALEKIDAAIALQPERADFHFLRGNILQSSDLKQALQAYEETLRLDPNHARAKQNRDLCAKVISENPNATVLPDEAVFDLIAQIMGQGRLEDALQMINDFAALKGVTLEVLWRNRLEQVGLTGVAKDWFSIDARGAVSLIFSKLQVSEIRSLRGMPLEELTLSKTSVRDITALTGMPLRRLNLYQCNNIRDLTPLAKCEELRELVLPPNATDIEILRRLPNLERISYQSTPQGSSWTPSQTAAEFWKNPYPASAEEMVSNLAEDATEVNFSGRDISDLSQLAGRPIRRLSLSNTKVADLTPLAGMSLEELTLSQTTVRDITALKGMPLRRLNLRGCKNIRDLSLLAECEELRDLVLPPNATDIEFLRRLPKLERISYQSTRRGPNWTPSQTAAEFWKNPYPASSEESVVESVEEMLSNLAEDATDVSFSGRDISDLSQLAGRPIRRLSLYQTKVADLTPLVGMPLEELTLSKTTVRDITALKGMPLRRLNLRGCKNIRDLSLLAECEELRDLVLPPNATEIEFLRRLPNLERISYQSTQQGGSWTPSQTAAEFWKNPHPASSEEALSNLAEDAMEVSLSRRDITDLSRLAGRPIRRLSLNQTKVTDLTPLAGMPLEELTLSHTTVRDITALKGMPLRRLNLSGCYNIRDLNPLAECEELRELVLPPNATEIEFLRRLPNLERISYKSTPHGPSWTPSQTVEEFWAEYDGRKRSAASADELRRAKDVSSQTSVAGEEIAEDEKEPAKGSE